MSKEFPLNFGENFVSIDTTTWSDLIGHSTDFAFTGVAAVIENVVANDGHFMIVNEDGSVHRRIDRTSEVKELIAKSSEYRESIKKQTYIRITFADGTQCTCEPKDVADMTEGATGFKAEEVQMTSAEFEAMPEFQG